MPACCAASRLCLGVAVPGARIVAASACSSTVVCAWFFRLHSPVVRSWRTYYCSRPPHPRPRRGRSPDWFRPTRKVSEPLLECLHLISLQYVTCVLFGNHLQICYSGFHLPKFENPFTKSIPEEDSMSTTLPGMGIPFP